MLRRIAFFTFAVLFSCASAAFLQHPLHAEEALVPRVEGGSLDDARASLQRLGYGVRVIEVAGGDEGVIANQEPRPGSALSRGSTVTLRVGVAARVKTTMPNVVGLELEDALAALGRAYDVRVAQIDVAAERSGKVMATRPGAGEETWFRAPVVVVVGTGPLGRLPGDSGTPEAAMEPAPSIVAPVPPTPPAPAPTAPAYVPPPPAHLPPPTVFPSPSAAPPGGAPANQGTPHGSSPAVAPTLADIPVGTPVRMPNVLGKSELEAMRLLAAVGIRPEVVRVDDASAAPGSVLMQLPTVSAETTAGAVSWLTISKGGAVVVQPTIAQPDLAPNGFPPPSSFPPPVEPAPPGSPIVPNLIGLDATQAADAVAAAGFVPHPWFISRSGTRDWEVVMQKDPSGTALAAGSVIHFRVALPTSRTGEFPVPRLFGLTKEQAMQVARGLGAPLTARLIDPEGTVQIQRPLVGTSVPWGSTLGIVVGSSVDPAAVAALPEVVLVSPEEAASTLAPPPTAPAPAKRKKDIFDRVGDFIDDRADDVRGLLD